MPRPVIHLTVFVASPAEVSRERTAVRKAADEVNRTVGEAEGFHIDVKTWETHTRPAATKRGQAQDAIFQQIGEYDIFVGIMWKRIGSRAGRAISGTVAEYSDVRQKWLRRKNKPSIMFYFRRTVVAAIDSLDSRQLEAVQQFKKRVFTDGLAREYESVPDFEALMRVHLVGEARELLKRWKASKRKRKKASTPKGTSKATPKKRSTPSPRASKKREK
jgi:hypothetical protein